MTRTWYAFRTAPQKEFAVRAIMDRIGIPCAVPTETKLRRSRKRREKPEPHKYPMLIGYVFLAFDGEPPWYHLFGELRCLKSVVGFDGRPARFSDDAIAELLGRQGQAIPHTRSVNTRVSFVPGDTVLVSSGPLRGYEGRVETVIGERARLQLQILGLSAIDIPISNLEAA